MTNDELLEGLARAIWVKEWNILGEFADYDFQPESVHEQYQDLAQAVIDYLTPMMREVLKAAQELIYNAAPDGYRNALCNQRSYYDDLRKALASFPKCWKAGE